MSGTAGGTELAVAVPPDRPGLLPSVAQLLALTGLAITQPVLDVFGRAPDIFLFRDSDRADIVAFAILVALVPALVLAVVEVVVGLASSTARWVVHVAFVAALTGLLALVVVKQADLVDGAAAVIVALAAAAIAAFAYRRWALPRLFLTYLGLAPILFVGTFLTTSPTSDLLAGQDVAAADIAPARNARSVVFLQLDELPTEILVDQDGAIDADLYPNLAALAVDGTWYRNATTVTTFTSYAIPAILTGRRPTADRTAVASEYPESLFTLLANEFDLDVVETVTQLCPPNLCDEELLDDPAPRRDPEAARPDRARPPEGLDALIDDAVDAYAAMASPDPADDGSTQLEETTSVVTTPPPPTTRPTQGPDARSAADDAASGEEPTFSVAGFARIPVLELDSVRDLTTSIEAGEDPTLHYLHLLLPHAPYQFLPSGQSYDPGATLAGGGATELQPRSTEQAAVDVARQRLVMQTMYVDDVIGDVVHRLRRTGLYDDAIVVVTADHGVVLQPGGTPRPVAADALEEDAYGDLLPVPLVIAGPGIEPGVVSDDNVETIDILPTLAELLGVDLPWPVDGIPVTSERREDPEKTFHLVYFSLGLATQPELGEETTYDGERVLADALARNVDTLFRSDNDRYRLYDIHPAGELVGAEVEDLLAPADQGLRLTFDDPAALDAVDPASGVLETHLTGRLDGAVPDDDVTVAIALNGTVAGIVTPWVDGAEGLRFEVMVVPELLRAGANDLAAYRVLGEEGDRRLAPVEIGP